MLFSHKSGLVSISIEKSRFNHCYLVLGSSHGFDPEKKTTGFVLWVNRRGIVVDPPLNSAAQLHASGVPSRYGIYHYHQSRPDRTTIDICFLKTSRHSDIDTLSR